MCVGASGDGFEDVRLVRTPARNTGSLISSLTFDTLCARIRTALGDDPSRKLEGLIAKIHQALRPHIAEMFFARVPILVEGLEDASYITTALHHFGQWSEFRRLGCHIIPVNGNRLKKEVLLSPEFQALWDRIKPKTTYRVEFETDELVRRAVAAIKKMETIESAKIRVTAGQIGVVRGGVTTTGISVAEEQTTYRNRPVPDILAYLQNETELTRSTLVRILKESDRLAEFFADPQRFMDAIADILKHELHRLLVDGIKYEKIDGGGPETEWEMLLFKNEELVNYLNALAVNHSLYEYVVYESEVEKEFAKKLDQREDIRLFVKLPGWFEIDTPVGKYNPDWAIIKHDDQTLYFVRETKSTKDFMKLRTSEADKIRCGQKHFETLGASFSVVVSADEV